MCSIPRVMAQLGPERQLHRDPGRPASTRYGALVELDHGLLGGGCMHVHRPKLVHGLGEFLKEYGIIVLGVLTALALEQAVETWRSHETLALIRASLGQELAEDRGRWEFLRKQDDCMQQRAESVIAWTRSGAPGAA